MSALRVLHIIPAVAARYGGPSRAIFEMCRALASHGAEVLIATTDADGHGHLAVDKEIVIDYQGARTIFFRNGWNERFNYSAPLARWLDDNVKRFDVAHIHAVFSHPCIAAAIACRKSGVPYIVRPLGSLDPWSMKQKRMRKLLMWRAGAGRMLREAAAIHYTTADERRLAEASLALDNGVVIPLGIETDNLQGRGVKELFRPRQASLGDRPYLLTLSRVHPKKNIELLIEAFLALAAEPEFDEWRLVIAGDGEAAYIDSLKLMADKSGGRGRVIFSGWLDGDERVAALAGAELLALTSHQENFGLAAAEALACGVPVIVSTGVNLAREIEAAGAGWVVSLDCRSLSSALREALAGEQERKRRGRAGRELAARQFCWQKLSADLIDLYARVAGRSAEMSSAV
ncbi:MAG TPA: glycosyltransferase [Blastocatellia bacterium]|nr:glycosyltransferase [Blastocatellia bacterium]